MKINILIKIQNLIISIIRIAAILIIDSMSFIPALAIAGKTLITIGCLVIPMFTGPTKE